MMRRRRNPLMRATRATAAHSDGNSLVVFDLDTGQLLGGVLLKSRAWADAVVNYSAAVKGYGPLAYYLTAWVKQAPIYASMGQSRAARKFWAKNAAAEIQNRAIAVPTRAQFIQMFGEDPDAILARGARLSPGAFQDMLAEVEALADIAADAEEDYGKSLHLGDSNWKRMWASELTTRSARGWGPRRQRQNPVPAPYPRQQIPKLRTKLLRAAPDLKGGADRIYYEVQLGTSEAAIRLWNPDLLVSLGVITANPVASWRIYDLPSDSPIKLMSDHLGAPIWAIGAARLEDSYKGQGGGRWIYELLLHYLQYQQKGPVILAADELFGGSTSDEAANVWASLRKDYVGGHFWVSSVKRKSGYRGKRRAT